MVCLDAILWLPQLFQNETTYVVFWADRPYYSDAATVSSHPISRNHGINVMPIGIFFGMVGFDFSNFEP
jgi:hypothetical protein